MKKILILLILCIGFQFGFAQKTKKPNYKKIEKVIKEKDSDFYYSKLQKKFEDADTTMTLNEKRHLYYGYRYQDSYSPYSHSDYQDSVRVISMKKELNFEDYELLDVYTDSILKQEPFNLRAMSAKLYALDKLFKRKKVGKVFFKANTVIDAILSSGDGLTKKTSYYVINPTHEYGMLDVLGYDFGGQQSLIEHYDYLTLGENENGIEGLYFDVTPSLNALSKMFK